MARLNKILAATTAIIALGATGAHANTISGSTVITTTQYTSESHVDGTATQLGGAGINVSGSAVISVTDHAAIEISGTVATQVSNTVNISSSATVSSGQVSGTIAIMPDSEGAVTINNSGTIINLGTNGYAISGTGAVAGEHITIRNDGTISGSIATGAGDDVFTNSGSINGNIDLGAGANSLSLTGGVISGTVTTAGGADVFTITGGRVVGAINLGGGTDTVNVSGTGFTTSGTISGVETVNVSSTLNIQGNGFSTDLTTMRVASGAAVNVSTNTLFADNASTLLNVSGTLNVAAGKSVSASTVSFANGGVFGVHISDSTSYGYIERDGAGSFTGGSLTVHLGNSYINSGTQFRIVSATGGSAVTATPSLTTSTQGLYTFYVSTTNANNGVSLTIYRAATSSAATNGTNAAIGAVLDNVSSSTNATLSGIHTLLNAQTTTGGVNTVLEKLNPAVDTGAAMAAVDVATQTGGQISTRLASLRGNSVNTGDGMFSNHFWMQGFGNITEQDDKDGRKGYDANTYGASFGLDTDTLIDGATTGAAFSYGKSNVESNNANGAQTDVDNYLVTLYGSRVFDHGVFINALGSVGFGQYETDRNTGLGKAYGDFDGMQYSAKLETGKDFVQDWWTVTPAISAQYTYVDMDSYRETGPGATLNVDSQSFNALDLGAGAQVAYNMPLESGGTLSPRVRAKVIYRAGDDSVETNSRFTAGGAAFNTQGVEADRTSLNLGAGILLTTVGGVDLSADYDADIRDSLTGHTGQLKARWAF